jgi:PTS system ascorbate-specific IIA component
MSVGVLLITHDQIGTVLLDTAVKILGRCPLHAEVLSIPLNGDVDVLRRNALALTHAMDEGQGVLVLTDIFGATPSNIAASLAQDGRVSVVAGLNLPMLVRVLNYPQDPLAGLTEKALAGGNRGILACEARPPD